MDCFASILVSTTTRSHTSTYSLFIPHHQKDESPIVQRGEAVNYNPDVQTLLIGVEEVYYRAILDQIRLSERTEAQRSRISRLIHLSDHTTPQDDKAADPLAVIQYRNHAWRWCQCPRC